jgi:Lrp/AsnC family transcriptional regulator for asnA, asnC and gidA
MWIISISYMANLCEIDIKILKELLKDGRKSFTNIAKDCHTTTDIISKHYREMEKAGIIVGATIQYNYPRFGYQGIASILINVKSQYLNEVLDELTKIPNINPFRKPFRLYNSTYNIGVIATIKNLKDLDRVKEALKRQNSIIASRTYLWTDVRNMPENLSLGFAQNSDFFDEQTPKEECAIAVEGKLDETDLQIVEELTKSGRAPFSRIAQTIGSSPDTIARRYARLVQNGFIKVTIQMNPILLNYKAIVNFFIAFLSQNETKKAVEILSKIPNVSYIVKISGDYDLQITTLVKEIDEIYKINDEIMKIPDIGRIEAEIREILPCWPGPRQYISTF